MNVLNRDGFSVEVNPVESLQKKVMRFSWVLTVFHIIYHENNFKTTTTESMITYYCKLSKFYFDWWFQYHTNKSDTSVREFCDKQKAYLFQESIQPIMHRLNESNRSRGFQNFWVIETGFSDFDKMTVAVLWSNLPKLGPKIVIFSGFKNFWNEKFWSLSNKECQKFQNTFELDCFLNIFIYVHSILLNSVLSVILYNIAECGSTCTFKLLYICMF